MPKDVELNSDAITDLCRLASSVGLGATVASTEDWGTVFGSVPELGPRNPATNTLLGITLTRPGPSLLVIGAAYDDHTTGQADEDYFVFDERGTILSAFYGNRWERADPRYRGTHHGDKDYLRDEK